MVAYLGFLVLVFPPGFDEAGVAGAANASSEDVAAHSARRLASATRPPIPDTQVDLHPL